MLPDPRFALTAISLNCQYGGRSDSDGRPENRWSGLVDLVSDARPDLLFLQECSGWWADPRYVARAEDDLGLRFKVAPSPSGLNTALGFRPDRLRWLQFETKYAHETLHGFGVGVFEWVADPVLQLTAISAHLTPYGAPAAADEAGLIVARLYRYGGIALLGGDINHVPIGDDEPDWSAVPPYNLSGRTLMRDGQLVGDTIVANLLARAKLVDVAARLQPDPSQRHPTGKGGVRVDQMHVTPPLAKGLMTYALLPTGELSDHDAIVATFDLSRVDYDDEIDSD